MTTDEPVDIVEVINDEQRFTLREVCLLCRVERSAILELIEFEVIVIKNPDTAQFDHLQLNTLMRALRLQRDLEINSAGAALALELLDTIDELKKEVTLLRRHVDSG